MSATPGSILHQWSSLAVIAGGYLLGIFLQNRRINDLRDTVNRRFDDLRETLHRRFGDLHDMLKRIEQPIVRQS